MSKKGHGVYTDLYDALFHQLRPNLQLKCGNSGAIVSIFAEEMRLREAERSLQDEQLRATRAQLDALVSDISMHLRESLLRDPRPLGERLAEELKLRAIANLRRIDRQRATIVEQNRRAEALASFIRAAHAAEDVDIEAIVVKWEIGHPLAAEPEFLRAEEDDALTLTQLQSTIASLEASLRERAENEARLAAENVELRAQRDSAPSSDALAYDLDFARAQLAVLKWHIFIALRPELQFDPGGLADAADIGARLDKEIDLRHTELGAFDQQCARLGRELEAGQRNLAEVCAQRDRLAEQCGTLSAAMLGFLREELRPAPGETLPPHEWTARITAEIHHREELLTQYRGYYEAAQAAADQQREALREAQRLADNLQLDLAHACAQREEAQDRAIRNESYVKSAETQIAELQRATIEQAVLLANLISLDRARRRADDAQHAIDMPF